MSDVEEPNVDCLRESVKPSSSNKAEGTPKNEKPAVKTYTMRRVRDNEKINTDEEYYQYHRTIEDSVDIFYNPDEDGEPHQSEFTLNLGDLVISEKPLKKRKQQESECSSQFEVIDLEEDTVNPDKSQGFPQVLNISNYLKTESCTFQQFDASQQEQTGDHSQMLNISDILKKEGQTFQQFNANFDQIQEKDFNFEQEVEKIKLDERFHVAELCENQYFIDATKYFNAWNPDKIEYMESTVVIVINYLKKNEVNVLINSTIAENLSKHNKDFWKEVVSKSDSLWNAVQSITVELAESSGIIERMKLCSSFYNFKTLPEMLNSSEEWKNQLPKNVFPNRFDHDSWTTASEFLNVGKRLEWATLKNKMGGDEHTVHSKKEDICNTCKKTVPGHVLFVLQGSFECSDCLRSSFYKEFSIMKVPVTSKLNTLGYNILSTIVPLTVLNLYTRKCAILMLEKNSDEVIFEKCLQCRAFILFSNLTGQNLSLSCPCGNSWCQKCKDPPHWPMTCEVAKEWKKKWDLRYNLENAQGTGSEALIQVTCHCQQIVYYVRTPKETMECPACKLVLDTGGMTEREFFADYPWRPCFRRLHRYGHLRLENYISMRENEPYAKITTKLSKIPSIKASVIKTCKMARDLRFDQKLHIDMVRREKNLIRKKVLTESVLGDLISTTLYLVESVNGWMNETNKFDKTLSQVLEESLKNLENLILAVRNDTKLIVDFVKILENNRGIVIKMVKSKLKSC